MNYIDSINMIYLHDNHCRLIGKTLKQLPNQAKSGILRVRGR